MTDTRRAENRVDWVDAAKGLCIILVVMVHATIGVEIAMGERGFMHAVVAWARPFRMPDFFLISGLFLGLTIDRPWRRYLDRKVVHFLYFYLLWLTIQFAFKAPEMAAEAGDWTAPLAGFLEALWQPFGTLWFIYVLPVFFLFTRLVRGLPVWFVLAWAALLEALPVHTGSVVFDEFAQRYVFFFIGYAFAPRILAFASAVAGRPAATLAALVLWSFVNGALVFTPAPDALGYLIQGEIGDTGATGGLSELPGVSLLLGLAGALAIVAVASLVARAPWAFWLRWLGRHSIVVYLAFFLPMAATRIALVSTGLLPDVGLMALVTTAAGIAGPAVLYALVAWSGRGRFLFERPAWASIERGGAPASQAA
ncbi:MAG: acyltransferase family protein [Mesorhizobium sp.]